MRFSPHLASQGHMICPGLALSRFSSSRLLCISRALSFHLPSFSVEVQWGANISSHLVSCLSAPPPPHSFNVVSSSPPPSPSSLSHVPTMAKSYDFTPCLSLRHLRSVHSLPLPPSPSFLTGVTGEALTSFRTSSLAHFQAILHSTTQSSCGTKLC